MGKLNNLIMFTVGAVVGSAVTWKITKTKYEKIAQEEIDSVKESYSSRYEQSTKEKKNTIEAQTEEDLNDNNNELNEYRKQIRRYSNNENIEGEEEKNIMNDPYVIQPDDFNQFEGYEERYLTLYADGVVVDDFASDGDETISDDDLDELIGGRDILDHIGEYEDDILHVRNEYLKMDFEISKNYRSFSEL